jgi:hypothetical protein
MIESQNNRTIPQIDLVSKVVWEDSRSRVCDFGSNFVKPSADNHNSQGGSGTCRTTKISVMRKCTVVRMSSNNCEQ